MSKSGFMQGVAQGAQIGLQAWMNDSLSKRRDERLQAYRKENNAIDRADKKIDVAESQSFQKGLIAEEREYGKGLLSDSRAHDAKVAETKHQNDLEITDKKYSLDGGKGSSEQRLFEFYRNEFPEMGKEEILSIVKSDKSQKEQHQTLASKIVAGKASSDFMGEYDAVADYQSILNRLEGGVSDTNNDSDMIKQVLSKNPNKDEAWARAYLKSIGKI